MLYEAKLDLYLDSEANIAKKQPDKMFAKFFHTLTAGKLLPEEEQQTFTAIEILQDFNRLFRKNGITNVISLSKDGYRFYHDQNRTDDDIKEAMRAFQQNNDQLDAELFEHVYLSLEHRYQGLEIFIEVDISRVHNVGAAPITIRLSALIEEFAKQKDESEQALLKRMKGSLKGEQYHLLVDKYKQSFEQFTFTLAQEIKKELNIKRIDTKTAPSVVRPHRKGAKSPHRRSKSHSVFNGSYANSPMTWLYAFLWMDLMTDMDISAGAFDVLDESGDIIDSVTAPIQSSTSALLNPDVELDNLEMNGGIETVDELEKRIQSTDSGSWIAAFSDSDGSSDGGSCGSSCGSSCGGGCGG